MYSMYVAKEMQKSKETFARYLKPNDSFLNYLWKKEENINPFKGLNITLL